MEITGMEKTGIETTRMETTSGLVSAYQLMDYSALRIAEYNLSVTPIVVTIPSPFKLPEEFQNVRQNIASTPPLDLSEIIYPEAYRTMIASEQVLARDWDHPDEDEAWRCL